MLDWNSARWEISSDRFRSSDTGNHICKYRGDKESAAAELSRPEKLDRVYSKYTLSQRSLMEPVRPQWAFRAMQMCQN